MSEQLTPRIEMPASQDHLLELAARQALAAAGVVMGIDDDESVVDTALRYNLVSRTPTVVEFVAPADLEVAD